MTSSSPLRRHTALALVLLVGVVLRVLGVVPSRIVSTDASPTLGGLVAVALTVAGYVVMRRWDVWRWLAAAAMAPLLWGGRPLVEAHLALFLTGPLLGLLAAVGLGRARASGMRGLCPLVTVVPALALLLGETARLRPDPGPAVALVLWPVAGALAVTALLRGSRGAATRRSQVDEVDLATSVRFAETYGRPDLGPVVVVIAAYDEAEGLPRVLETMPSTLLGLPTDVLVVDDGSQDGTAGAVQAAGRGYAVACPTNRGQGAALRLGYRIAREHGAQYLLTTDADGQYDVADLPVALAPVVEGRADFVTGSRRLGHDETDDGVRRLGVYIFAAVVSALVGRRLTDTSFGLRAMRADLTARVTLNQPQYQSSELLIGAISHGYRVLEVPGRMAVRGSGSTKKGGNLTYGLRYARVVLGTWWREGAGRPVTETAPALAAHRRSDPTPEAVPR